jgi:hypothetical protein
MTLEQRARLIADPRVVSWFSHGAASAVATKLALRRYGIVPTCDFLCAMIEQGVDWPTHREWTGAK